MSDDNFNAKEVSRQTSKAPNPQEKFWDVADSFVHLANENCKQVERGQVCAAMMFSAARFNAFTTSVDAPDAEVFAKEVEPAIAYFRDEFEKMLRENFRDYAKNFNSYHPEKG